MKKCLSLGVAILAMVTCALLVASSHSPLHSGLVAFVAIVWTCAIGFYVTEKY